MKAALALFLTSAFALSASAGEQFICVAHQKRGSFTFSTRVVAFNGAMEVFLSDSRHGRPLDPAFKMEYVRAGNDRVGLYTEFTRARDKAVVRIDFTKPVRKSPKEIHGSKVFAGTVKVTEGEIPAVCEFVPR